MLSLFLVFAFVLGAATGALAVLALLSYRALAAYQATRGGK